MIEEMRSLFTVTILRAEDNFRKKCQTESKALNLRKCRREKKQMEKSQGVVSEDSPALSSCCCSESPQVTASPGSGNIHGISLGFTLQPWPGVPRSGAGFREQ